MMNASPGVPGINFRSSLRPYRRRRGSLILVCYVLGRGRSITTKTDFKFYCFFSCFYLVFMLWDFFILVLKLFSCFISRIVLFNICIRVYVLKLGLIEICINFITVMFFFLNIVTGSLKNMKIFFALRFMKLQCSYR